MVNCSRPCVFVGIVLALALFRAASSEATTLVPADLSELSREARAIVRGRVVAVEPRWTADRRSIETLVTVDAEASLKGPLGRTVSFLVPGGSLGRYRSIFIGAPTFAVNQRIVAFLGWNGPSYPYVLGLNQGIYHLEIAADGRRWLVAPPPVVSPRTGAVRIVRGDDARQRLPLADFEQLVRTLAGGSR